MIKISEIKLSLDYNEADLKNAIIRILRISPDKLISYKIVRKSVDARKKDNIFFTFAVLAEIKGSEAKAVKASKSKKVEIAKPEEKLVLPAVSKPDCRPVIAGFGPAGMFAGLLLARAGLEPIILERGRILAERQKDVLNFWNNRSLNEESNVQYGEGGAGTFSDGKLNTGIKDNRCQYVLETFKEHGAPEEITYSAKPHIGTDKLGDVVTNIRKEIESLGGEVRFNTRLEKLIIYDNSLRGITCVSNGESYDIEADALILAIGNSARDTVEMLYNSGINVIQKAFSIGARIEHPRELIDKAQYGAFAGHPALGAANYKLACHGLHERGAYTFCMCPGGTVVAGSSEKGGVVVNGMSEFARNGRNSNSALLVGIEPKEFGSDNPLEGIAIQRRIERAAYKLAGKTYQAPAQLVGDFLKDKPSTSLGDVIPTCPTGVVMTDLRECLPEKTVATMKNAIVKMNDKLEGFALYDAVLTAPETRSSAPVRIPRDDWFQANVNGIYPCGEGAGYAGGIVSAAVDGIKCAVKLMENINEGI